MSEQVAHVYSNICFKYEYTVYLVLVSRIDVNGVSASPVSPA